MFLEKIEIIAGRTKRSGKKRKANDEPSGDNPKTAKEKEPIRETPKAKEPETPEALSKEAPHIGQNGWRYSGKSWKDGLYAVWVKDIGNTRFYIEATKPKKKFKIQVLVGRTHGRVPLEGLSWEGPKPLAYVLKAMSIEVDDLKRRS